MKSNKNSIFIITDSLGFNGWGEYTKAHIEILLRDNSSLKIYVFFKLKNTFNISDNLVNKERLIFVKFTGIYFIDKILLKIFSLVCKPHLVHFMSEPCANLITGIIKSFEGKIIQTIHGTYGYLFLGKYNKFLKVIDSIIYNSEFTKCYFNFPISSYKQFVLFPLSTSFMKIENQIQSNVYEKDNQLVFIGNSKERKGLSLVLSMFEVLCNEVDDLKLVIIGNLNDAHTKLISLNSNILHFNKVSESELIKLVSLSKVNLLPSKNVLINGILHFEGYGLVHIESIKLGTPSIGCSNSGNESFILDGINGFLVDQGNLSCLIESTRKLMNLGKNSQFYESVSDSIESINSIVYGKQILSIYGIK